MAFGFCHPHLSPAVNPAGTLVHTGQGRDVEIVMVHGRFVVENDDAADGLWARAGS
jgi:5-methylthioadenosine/S-adenosylhomocysteine deaminase